MSTDHPSNETLALLARRRSPKLTAFTEHGPSDQQVATLLTLAARVPDHGKLVPWRFIIIAGDRRSALGEVIGAVYDRLNPAADGAAKAEARRRLTYAPLVVAVVQRTQGDPAEPSRPHPKIPEWEQILSAGAVCMNLVVAANAMNFGALWLTEWYAFNRDVLDAMGLEPRERIAGFIHIGTVREAREDRDRPEMSRIVSRY